MIQMDREPPSSRMLGAEEMKVGAEGCVHVSIYAYMSLFLNLLALGISLYLNQVFRISNGC